MHYQKKQRPEEFLNKYRNLIYSEMAKEQMVIFSDGSADIQQGQTLIQEGYAVFDQGHLIKFGSERSEVGFNTSVKSEFQAMCMGLEYLMSINYKGDVLIFNDSSFVVEYGVQKLHWQSESKDKGYYPAFIRLRGLIKEFKSVFAYWIPRELNTITDKLSKSVEINMSEGDLFPGFIPSANHVYPKDQMPDRLPKKSSQSFQLSLL